MNEAIVGVKFDQGKAPISMIPKQYIEGTAQVLSFGAKKYSRDNWRLGMKWTRLIDAAMRHTLAFNEGEDIDPESGLHHLYHASCCLSFLTEYQSKSLGEDDRYKIKKEKDSVGI